MNADVEALRRLAGDEELGAEDHALLRAVLRTIGSRCEAPPVGRLLTVAERRRRGTASVEELRDHVARYLRALALAASQIDPS